MIDQAFHNGYLAGTAGSAFARTVNFNAPLPKRIQHGLGLTNLNHCIGSRHPDPKRLVILAHGLDRLEILEVQAGLRLVAGHILNFGHQ